MENGTNELKIVDPQSEVEYKKYSNEEIEQKQKEVDDFKNELQNKQYLVSENKDLAYKILKWLKTEAPWTYSESIGVVKLVEDLEAIINKKDTKNFLMSMGAVTAVNYLLQKATGLGFESAKKIMEMVQPIIDVLNGSIKRDTQLVQKMEFELSSMIEGIVPKEGEELE